MKKIILAMTILGLAASQVQTSKAGGFSIAVGGVGGVAVGASFGVTLPHPPFYCAPAPVYPCAPVVYARPAAVFCAPPVCIAPPVVAFGFGFGRPCYQGYRGRYCAPAHYSYHGHGHR